MRSLASLSILMLAARRDVKAAAPTISLIAILSAALGAILFLGGVALGAAGVLAQTTISLFGNAFSSVSVGVALAFLGVVFVGVVFRRALSSLEVLAALPPSRRLELFRMRERQLNRGQRSQIERHP